MANPFAPVRHTCMTGEPSHFGSAAQPGGRSEPAMGVVSIGAGSVHVIREAFHPDRRVCACLLRQRSASPRCWRGRRLAAR